MIYVYRRLRDTMSYDMTVLLVFVKRPSKFRIQLPLRKIV